MTAISHHYIPLAANSDCSDHVGCKNKLQFKEAVKDSLSLRDRLKHPKFQPLLMEVWDRSGQTLQQDFCTTSERSLNNHYMVSCCMYGNAEILFPGWEYFIQDESANA